MEEIINRYKSLKNDIDMHYSIIDSLEDRIQSLKEKIEEGEITIDIDLLRPIKPSDVKEGQIVFGDYGHWCIQTIQEVIHPHSSFKAWISDDGCRYGLENSYVLK